MAVLPQEVSAIITVVVPSFILLLKQITVVAPSTILLMKQVTGEVLLLVTLLTIGGKAQE